MLEVKTYCLLFHSSHSSSSHSHNLIEFDTLRNEKNSKYMLVMDDQTFQGCSKFSEIIHHEAMKIVSRPNRVDADVDDEASKST